MKLYYETVVLLAAGAALGQLVIVLTEMSFSIWSFIPMMVVVAGLGVISLRSVAASKGLVHSSTKVRLATGVWAFLIWELLRRRVLWNVDIFKFGVLFLVLYLCFCVVRREWRE